MDERAVYAGLTQIFRDLFNDDTIVLSAETSAADIEGWDSFNNITLMVAAETEFGVSAAPRPYGFGLDVFRKRHGMRSSTALCG